MIPRCKFVCFIKCLHISDRTLQWIGFIQIVMFANWFFRPLFSIYFDKLQYTLRAPFPPNRSPIRCWQYSHKYWKHVATKTTNENTTRMGHDSRPSRFPWLENCPSKCDKINGKRKKNQNFLLWQENIGKREKKPIKWMGEMLNSRHQSPTIQHFAMHVFAIVSLLKAFSILIFRTHTPSGLSTLTPTRVYARFWQHMRSSRYVTLRYLFENGQWPWRWLCERKHILWYWIVII